MKKLLLFAASLVAFASAYAQDSSPVVYRMGDVVNSEADLTTGTYFIRAHANAGNDYNMGRGEYMVYDMNETGGHLAAHFSTIYNLSAPTTDNYALVWNLEVTDVTDDNRPAGSTGTKVFTIQNLSTNDYWSTKGNNGSDAYPAKNQMCKSGCTAHLSSNTQHGLFQLVELNAGVAANATDEHAVQGGYAGNQTDCKRFFLQLTNAQFQNGNVIVYPFVHTSSTTPVSLSFWANNALNSTAVQFDIVKAEPVISTTVKVQLPAINGYPVAEQEVTIGQNMSLEDAAKVAVAQLDNGNFKFISATSTTGSDLVTTAGETITVEGRWEREMIPNMVYRVRISTRNDNNGALRYMLKTGEIETRREGLETLTRMVPERLWYFSPVGDLTDSIYTLHTLYDTEKAVYYPNSNNGTHAQLGTTDQATKFKFIARPNGDFVLNLITDPKSNAKVNDFGGNEGDGCMAVYHHGTVEGTSTDNGCQMRVYPLLDADFEALTAFATGDEIATAQATPSVENVKPLIDAYNAQNLEAALKRLEYLFGTGTIGNNPGQYSDADGSFAAAAEHAREVANNPDATEEEIAEAVAAIDVTKVGASEFTFNDVLPGHFYRFRNKFNNRRYISALNGGVAAGKQSMAMTEDNTRSNTIFYVQEKTPATGDEPAKYTVICYENGTVLPGLVGTSWMPALDGTANASSDVMFNYKNDGTFVIHVKYDTSGAHRHLHGGVNIGDGVVNAGGGEDGAFTWYIENVTELPLTFYNVMGMDDEYGDDGWSSVCSPVALEIPDHYQHLTAYTGVFDGTDYTGKTDINHIHATPIAPNAEGKVIIPAGQPALLFYDGEETAEENPNVSGSLLSGRSHITYINVNLVYDHESTGEVKGNLSGSYHGVVPTEGKEYYTLHASHSNNFRQYFQGYDGWNPSYDFVPGFKAYIENDPDQVDYYPIYTINPNTMVPQFDENGDNIGLSVEKDQDTGFFTLTITTPADDYTVYYKHTPEAAVQAIRRQANEVEQEFSDIADKDGKVHTITVETPGTVEYYAYHADSNTKGAVREIPINDEVATGIKSITADAANAAVCYDLQGRRIAAPAKGINIINNRKVLVK